MMTLWSSFGFTFFLYTYLSFSSLLSPSLPLLFLSSSLPLLRRNQKRDYRIFFLSDSRAMNISSTLLSRDSYSSIIPVGPYFLLTYCLPVRSFCFFCVSRFLSTFKSSFLLFIISSYFYIFPSLSLPISFFLSFCSTFNYSSFSNDSD